MLARAVRPSPLAGGHLPLPGLRDLRARGRRSGWASRRAATVAGLVVIVALYLRAFRNPAPSAVAVGLVVLATVAVMTRDQQDAEPAVPAVAGRADGRPAAAGARGTAAERRDQLRRLAGFLLVLALLTHLVYPLFYDGLLGRLGRPMIVAATVVTALRNLALVVFTVRVVQLAWRWLAPRQATGSAPRPASPPDPGRRRPATGGVTGRRGEPGGAATSTSPGTPSPAAGAGRSRRPRAPASP